MADARQNEMKTSMAVVTTTTCERPCVAPEAVGVAGCGSAIPALLQTSGKLADQPRPSIMQCTVQLARCIPCSAEAFVAPVATPPARPSCILQHDANAECRTLPCRGTELRFAIRRTAIWRTGAVTPRSACRLRVGLSVAQKLRQPRA